MSFEDLLAVQDLDTGIDRDRHRRAHLEERQAIASIDDRAADLGRRRRELDATRGAVVAREETLEAELEATEQRTKEITGRLYGGGVSASRELQAMAAEVEALKRRASELEDRVLEVLDEREPLDAGVGAIDTELAALADRRRMVGADLEEAEAAIDRDLESLIAQRNERAASLPPDLLATYDGLRSRLGGVGAARLVGSQCTGCHLTLPSMEMDRIRRQPPDALILCEDCGRILIR